MAELIEAESAAAVGVVVLCGTSAMFLYPFLFQAVPALAANPRLSEVNRLPADHETHLWRLLAAREPSPNVWTDAWLAALAICLSCEMVTFDRGFRAFDGVELRLLGAKPEG